MKNLYSLLILILSIQLSAQEAVTFDLKPDQSMSIIGQGPGQDAAINPFEGKDCKAIVENIGEGVFEIRVKNKDNKFTSTRIEPKETKTIVLLIGSILYLDSIEASKATISFVKM